MKLGLFLLLFSQLHMPYIQLDGNGVLKKETKHSSSAKIVTLYTIGGFTTIQLTDAFKRAPDLYLRAYDKKGDPTLPVELYLNPNGTYYIDILNRQTDSLVRRYIIKRVKVTPKIKLFAKSSVLPSHSNQFVLSPNEEVRLSMEQEAELRNLQLEYTLVNLKTKKTKYKLNPKNLESLTLVANTEYELRVNYVLQKETVGVYYLRVKPYWYQATITYILACLALGAIIIFIITRALKNKVRSSIKEQQKMEQAALRLQSLLNPHFTFNALSSIQGLMNTERIDEANQYLQEFSSLLRKTLAKSQHVFNNLDEELEMMRMYLKLEAFRFNFSWNIEVADTLNPSVIDIPTLLLQPLIENAIKHGLTGLGEKGKLLIVCEKGNQEGTLVISIKDNGQWATEAKQYGYGLSLTEERIMTINSMKKEQSIALNFNKEGGTTAVLTFHNWIDN